jgi:hypothetical protein
LANPITRPFWRFVGHLRAAKRGSVTPAVRDVKPFESRHLPPRFDVAHAVAFFFNDQLAALVRDLEASGALSMSIDLPEQERASLEAMEDGAPVFDWLITNGRLDIVNDLTYRQLTAVVADACHFLSESLISSGKGKTTVAYSLLRKPLKESLLLLEWLSVEPDAFLAKFHGVTTDGYVLNRLSEPERRRVIDESVKRVNARGITSDLLWLIRFDKNYSNSLETLWTKATHLVTTVKASATEPGNLNFIFSGIDAKEDQWEHYYRIVPMVLYYFVEVAEHVASRFFSGVEQLRSPRSLLRALAMLRWAETVEVSDQIKGTIRDSLQDLEDLQFQCVSCGETASAPAADPDRFWLRSEMECRTCGRIYDLWDVLKSSHAEQGVDSSEA